MSTLTITEFLEARIAEDEKQSREVLETVAPDAWENPTKWGNFFPADIAFYDTQTPYRVLAECAAKRAIIAAQKNQEDNDDKQAWIVASEVLLRALAAVYADHPDYDPEWAL